MTHDEPTRAQVFGQRIVEAARAAGYDIDSPRGGGKKALAQDAGMTPSSVGRMLAGQTMPDAYSLERLANALGLPVLELLVLHGIVSPGADLDAARPNQPTVREVVEGAGITSPPRVRMAVALINALIEDERKDSAA